MSVSATMQRITNNYDQVRTCKYSQMPDEYFYLKELWIQTYASYKKHTFITWLISTIKTAEVPS